MANQIDNLKNEQGELDKQAIMQIIPYDDPFVMIDKVTHIDKNKIVATKKISAEEFYFKGHFKDFPIMPGALIIEGIGQAATLLMRYNIENHQSKDILAYVIKKAKFFRPSFPGQELTYEINIRGQNEKGAKLKAKATRGEKQVAECSLVLAIVDKEQFRSRYTKK